MRLANTNRCQNRNKLIGPCSFGHGLFVIRLSFPEYRFGYDNCSTYRRSPDGEIGRRSGLKIRRPARAVGVQVPLRAPKKSIGYPTRPFTGKILIFAPVPLLVPPCSQRCYRAIEPFALKPKGSHRSIRRMLTQSCVAGRTWAGGAERIRVIFPGESPDSTRWNKNLASNPPSGKTTPS